MQKLTVLLAVAALIAVACATQSGVKCTRYDLLKTEQTLFNQWVKDHPSMKKYSAKALQTRFKIFEKNVQAIKKRNAGRQDHSEAYYCINDMTHLTAAEFKRFYLNPLDEHTGATKRSSDEKRSVEAGLPASLDWRHKKKGVVTAIHNQQMCGGCYAFAVADNVAMVRGVHGKGNTMMSPQQIIDCSGSFGDNGCTGGSRYGAFEYVNSTGGLATQKSYPFVDKNSSCRGKGGPGKIKTFQCFPKNDIAGITSSLVHNGPVTAGVYAENWQHYSGGVITAKKCGGQTLDHAINIIGYTKVKNVSVWIVKNQWGTSWGMKGYAYIARGTANACGIQTQVCTSKV